MARNSTQLAMREACERHGGKVEESIFLEAVRDIIVANVGEEQAPSLASLKSNCFTRNRMASAGVERVTIGSTKQIWLGELAEKLENGDLSGIGINPAMVAEHVNDADAPHGTFYGLARHHVDDWPSHLAEQIPSIQGFVESDRNEFRHLAAMLRRSLGGDTVNAHVAAFGPTGCGKSLMAREFAAHMQIPAIRINMSDGVSEETLLGRIDLDNGSTRYIDGILVEAMENGTVLICDEINAMRDNTQIAMFSAMDSGYLVLPDDNNRVVRAKKGFMVVGTYNPGYAGTNEQNEAFRNRFSRSLQFGYLPAPEETSVIQSQSGFMNNRVATEIVALANDLRTLKENRKGITSDVSTRSLIHILMDLRDGFSIAEAVNESFIGKFTPREIETVKMTARARLSDY